MGLAQDSARLPFAPSSNVKPTAGQQKTNRRRPKLFRALGNSEPPCEIVVDGLVLQHQETIKHDSWAATAIYANESQKVVCKFNRTQAIVFLPMRWLGKILAKRENDMYQRLADLPSIPKGYHKVCSGEQQLTNAAAHEFIEGNPVRWHDKLDDEFFIRLLATIQELHRRDIAYVELNKSENVIIDEAGAPYLIDFQISFTKPTRFPMKIWPLSWFGNRVLKVLQRCDLYHLAKLVKRFRPDQANQAEFARLLERPAWIKAHRKVAVPFRKLRRKLLVLFGIRSGKGKPHTELFIEEGLRAKSSDAKPIIKLYQLLMSEEYLSRYAATPEALRDQLHVDLSGKKPPQPGKISSTSNHDLVIDVLRSDWVYRQSNKWNDEWAQQKLAAINARLMCGNTLTSPAPQRLSA